MSLLNSKYLLKKEKILNEIMNKLSKVYSKDSVIYLRTKAGLNLLSLIQLDSLNSMILTLI